MPSDLDSLVSGMLAEVKGFKKERGKGKKGKVAPKLEELAIPRSTAFAPPFNPWKPVALTVITSIQTCTCCKRVYVTPEPTLYLQSERRGNKGCIPSIREEQITSTEFQSDFNHLPREIKELFSTIAACHMCILLFPQEASLYEHQLSFTFTEEEKRK